MSLRSKTGAQRQHAKRRAYERYGWDFNKHDMQALVKRIQQGDAQFVERQSLRVSVWDISISGEVARVVYDKSRKQIVTFLPKEAVSFNGRTLGSQPNNDGSEPSTATI